MTSSGVGGSPASPTNDREVSLVDLVDFARSTVRSCWARRLMFVRSIGVAVVVVLLYAFGSTREYTVTTKILPYRTERSALGGLSGLAGLAGVSLPLGSAGQVVPADLYPEVASSFSFRSDLAVTPIHFSDASRSYITFFDSVYAPSLVEQSVKYGVMLPLTAYEAIRGKLTPQTNAISAYVGAMDSVGIRSHSRRFVRIVDGMKLRVTTTLNKKTGIISITARMPDPVAAADLARVTADRLTAEIVRFESKKAAEQARFLGEQKDLAERRYRSAQSSVAEFQDRNKSLSSAVSQVELQRLQSDFTLAFDLYKNLATQYESARVKEREDTPVFSVIDPSVVPYAPSSPRKLQLLLLAVLVGGSVSIARVVIARALESGEQAGVGT